jgi:hypothetical protein
MSQTVRVLSYLEAYEKRQQEAQAVWKRAQWQLTKAKQRKGVTATDALTATNVREELRPRRVLIDQNNEPALVDEDVKSSSSAQPYFRLVDPVQEAQREKEDNQEADAAAAAKANSGTKDSSLRNRKTTSGKDEPATTTTWTVTNHEEADEETRLCGVDPLDLFGLPTNELRQAQVEARHAVQLYVEAANLLIALQNELVASA